MIIQAQVLREGALWYAVSILSPLLSEYQRVMHAVLMRASADDAIRTVTQDSPFFDAGAGMVDVKTGTIPEWVPFEDRVDDRPALLHVKEGSAPAARRDPIQDEFDRMLAGAAMVERKIRGNL